MIFLLLTTLFICACNLARSVTTTPEVFTTQPVGNRSGEIPLVDTPAATSDSTSCLPRTDWPVYVVAPGDILSDIASRTGSTVDELVAANCLDNPDAIDVGQELYVPRLPTDTASSSGSMTYTSTYGFAFDYPL